MIVIHLEDFYNNSLTVLDDAVIVTDNKLLITNDFASCDFKEFTDEHLQKMSISSFNKMVEDLMVLNPDLDLRTINMSLINHGEHLRKK